MRLILRPRASSVLVCLSNSPETSCHRVDMELNLLGNFKPFGVTQSVDFDAKAVFLDNQQSKYFLFGSNTQPVHDEEIFVSGRTVVWSAGQIVKKSVTLSQPVIKAIWASFVENEPKNHLCVLHRGSHD
jgi:hypothetical protein